MLHTVLACIGSACDLLSNEPFPYILSTCTWLCPATCIQETLRPKKGRTSHFTLEHVGWFPARSNKMPPHILPIRSLGPMEWLEDFLSEGMRRCSLPSPPKEETQLEIHLHNCSFETLTLGQAAATSFGGGTASSCPLHCPGANRSRVQTRSKVRKRTLSPQTMSHRGNQKYSGTVFSSVPYLILVIFKTTNAWHQLKSSAGD